MKITKKITVAVACAIMAVSSMVGMGASAAETIVGYTGNFYTYTHTSRGSVANFYGAPNAGTISSRSTQYDGNWKMASYDTYGDNNGTFYLIGGNIDSDTTASVTSGYVACGSDVAKRSYMGAVRNTSFPSSTIKETFNFAIVK